MNTSDAKERFDEVRDLRTEFGFTLFRLTRILHSPEAFMKKTIAITILLVPVCMTVNADQITLKNGDRLTGKIVKSDGGKLVSRPI